MRGAERRGARLAGAVAAVALLAAACSSGGSPAGRSATSAAGRRPAGSAAGGAPSCGPTPTPPPLPALHAVRGDHPAILDAAGRQVLLRGVNVNSLGEYPRANPALASTVAVTDCDWAHMAGEGFSVVRLLITWSRLEPTRGHVDTAYVATIRRAVRAAAAHGLYAVIDMHQDAWGPVATPPGVTCPAGKTAAIGWDGAPQWATPAAGIDSCRGGSREDSELVRTAWDRFYADAGGIESQLTSAWGTLVAALGAEPSVAGYDLLNEPGVGHDVATTLVGLARYDNRAIAAIRARERLAHVAAKPIFFEYTVFGQALPADFSAEPDLVFAPHIYGGSIGPLSVDQHWDYALGLARSYHTALWSGEYGWFDQDAAKDLAKVRRYGQREDLAVAGSAWWQWRQACGDPHSVGKPGGTPSAVVVEYQDNGCPGDRNLGVVPQWHEVVSRPHPRAAPGRITSLVSDGAARTLAMTATRAAAGPGGMAGSVEIWVPAGPRPVVGGDDLGDVQVHRLGDGWLITAQTCGTTYAVRVLPSGTRPNPVIACHGA